jgi:hypothetical protein
MAYQQKHLIDHRQQLVNQEHDLSQQEVEHSLFKKIDLWEKESIKKIQITAENARIELRQMNEKSKERFLKAYHEMDNYSEHELHRWMEQLKQFQLDEHKWSIIDIEDNTTTKNLSTAITQDRFSTVIGSVILDDEGFLAKHTADDWNYEYVLGEQHYSKGRHTILFQIEQNGTPYNIFFGCISSQAIQNRISIKSMLTVGWFGYNQIYQHGIRHDNPQHGYNSNAFATNDILHLTFDCEKRQIELFHEDTNKKYKLRVNITKAPFPWQLLMILTDKDDCIRILSIQK